MNYNPSDEIVNETSTMPYVMASRALLADTVLSNQAKILYLVILSLAQSCKRTFPSYAWFAEQVGYEPKSQDKKQRENTLCSYFRRYTDELSKFGLIVKKPKPNGGFQYIVKDYTPTGEKTPPPWRNKSSDPGEKTPVSNKTIVLRNRKGIKKNRNKEQCQDPVPITSIIHTEIKSQTLSESSKDNYQYKTTRSENQNKEARIAFEQIRKQLQRKSISG